MLGWVNSSEWRKMFVSSCFSSSLPCIDPNRRTPFLTHHETQDISSWSNLIMRVCSVGYSLHVVRANSPAFHDRLLFIQEKPFYTQNIHLSTFFFFFWLAAWEQKRSRGSIETIYASSNLLTYTGARLRSGLFATSLSVRKPTFYPAGHLCVHPSRPPTPLLRCCWLVLGHTQQAALSSGSG